MRRITFTPCILLLRACHLHLRKDFLPLPAILVLGDEPRIEKFEQILQARASLFAVWHPDTRTQDGILEI